MIDLLEDLGLEISERGIFALTVTSSHILLLQRLHFREMEGTRDSWASVNHFRPFGNMAIQSDMIEILGMSQPDPDDSWEAFSAWNDANFPTLDRLYREVTVALQINTSLAGKAVLRPGRYRMTLPYRIYDWERVEE